MVVQPGDQGPGEARRKAAHLIIAVPVLHDAPGQLRDGEGQREAELEVGTPGLKVPPAQVLPARTLALFACVRPPCQPLQIITDTVRICPSQAACSCYNRINGEVSDSCVTCGATGALVIAEGERIYCMQLFTCCCSVL